MFAHGVEFVGNLVGARHIALIAGAVSKLADFADGVAGLLQAFNLAEGTAPRGPARASSPLDWIIPPAHAQAGPPPLGAPGRPPSSLESVAFLSGGDSVIVDCRNATSTDFLMHNVFTIIRPIGQPRPATAQEVMSGSDTRSFALSMPANGTYRNETPFQGPVDQGYVTYTWCVPSHIPLSDEIVGRDVLLGPIFYNVDPYDSQVIDAVRREQTTASEPQPVTYEIPQTVSPA
jgi:hypothetical protein